MGEPRYARFLLGTTLRRLGRTDEAAANLANGTGEAAPITDPWREEVAESLVLEESAAGPRETVQAKALIEKAERIAARAAIDDKLELDRLIEGVRLALDDRRWDDLAAACGQLSDVLFYLEDA